MNESEALSLVVLIILIVAGTFLYKRILTLKSMIDHYEKEIENNKDMIKGVRENVSYLSNNTVGNKEFKSLLDELDMKKVVKGNIIQGQYWGVEPKTKKELQIDELKKQIEELEAAEE